MVADKNKKKSLDAPNQKGLPVTIVNSSFPDILCEERIHSWKNDYDPPVFRKLFCCHRYLDVSPTTVCLFGFFLMIKFQTYEKSVFFEI